MPEGPVAPGADDPATAVAVVLEAARIFSRQSFPFTIVYGLWDEEETYPYLTGSMYFADHAAAATHTGLCVYGTCLPDAKRQAMIKEIDQVYGSDSATHGR
jgi:Zn-dependent M28 family amino/carboxypeptidase